METKEMGKTEFISFLCLVVFATVPFKPRLQPTDSGLLTPNHNGFFTAKHTHTYSWAFMPTLLAMLFLPWPPSPSSRVFGGGATTLWSRWWRHVGGVSGG